MRFTTDAVMMLDDDIVLDSRDLRQAFFSWRQSATQLLGCFARAVFRGADGTVKYDMSRVAEHGLRSHNVVLTKFLVVHSRAQTCRSHEL